MNYTIVVGNQYDFCDLSLNGHENMEYIMKSITANVSFDLQSLTIIAERDSFDFISTIVYMLRNIYSSLNVKLVVFDSQLLQGAKYYSGLSEELYGEKLFDQLNIYGSLQEYFTINMPVKETVAEEPAPFVLAEDLFSREEPAPFMMAEDLFSREEPKEELKEEPAPFVISEVTPIDRPVEASSSHFSIEECRELILEFVKYKVEHYPINLQEESSILIDSIGLNPKDLESYVSLESCYKPISLMGYKWDNIFGSKANVDINGYIKACSENMKKIMYQKKENSEDLIRKKLANIIFKQGGAELFIKILSKENEFSIYHSIAQLKPDNYDHMVQINQDTYNHIKCLHESAGKEKRGLFGQREESTTELLDCVDRFLKQRQRIMEIECMIRIYDATLEFIEEYQYDINYSTEVEKYIEIFEQFNVYNIFQSDFHRSKQLDAFLEILPLADIQRRMNRISY